MPFPLAHPASVLPLRRYCPRWLSFPALVIGSLTPDAGYLLGGKWGEEYSHRLLGSVGFCLPLGIVLIVLFSCLRLPVVRMLPGPYQRTLLPLCRRPVGAPWVVLVSLLIGTWTHLFWDSFTHSNGWCFEHLPVLQSVVISVAGRTARVCHLLWYVCSFAGVIWLFVVFGKWKQCSVSGSTSLSGTTIVRDAVLVATLVLPIELVHHLIGRDKPGLYLVAALCALPVLVIILKVGKDDGRGAAVNQAAADGQDEEPATVQRS